MLKFLPEQRRQRVLFGLDLKAIHVNDKQRQEQETEQIGPMDGPADEHEQEAQIHWVTGVLINAGSHQDRSRLWLQRVNGCSDPPKCHAAPRGARQSHRCNTNRDDDAQRDVESQGWCHLRNHADEHTSDNHYNQRWNSELRNHVSDTEVICSSLQGNLVKFEIMDNQILAFDLVIMFIWFWPLHEARFVRTNARPPDSLHEMFEHLDCHSFWREVQFDAWPNWKTRCFEI